MIERRLSEFDGVITFQRLYERFESKSNHMKAWTEHFCDRNELDKREKEADILVANGGFIVFLLHKPFRDHIFENYISKKYTDSDLSKRFLNWGGLDRKDFNKRHTGLRCIRDEFRRFIELCGAARSSFSNYGDMSWRDIALIGSKPVSMIMADSLFFIPSLLPERSSERKEEFYRLLSDAVVTSVKKLRIELPAWTDSFILPNEQTLIDEQRSLSERLDEIEKERSIKNIKGPNALVKVWDSIRKGLPDPELDLETFFGIKPAPWSPNPERELTVLENVNAIYHQLNFLGYYRDSNMKTVRGFNASFNDMTHVGLASFCQLLIASDTNLIIKASAAYEYLGLRTNIVFIKR